MKLPNSDKKDEALQTPSITNSMRQSNTWTDYNQTVKSQEERILKAQEKWLSRSKDPNKSNRVSDQKPGRLKGSRINTAAVVSR